MVQHGFNEGVKNMYKTTVTLLIFKMKGTPGAHQVDPDEQKMQKGLKINVWRNRLGRSLAGQGRPLATH